MPTKVAFVTGSAIRVGRAISEHLAASGYQVWIHAHTSKQQALALVEQLGAQGLGPLVGDITSSTAREEMVGAICDPKGPAGGRLDLLVNNAASFERGRFLKRKDEDLRRVLATNLEAPLSLARQLAPALLATQGSMVHLLDVAAFDAWRGYVDHCISKSGLWMATRALALELAPVRVNGVAPGTVLWPEGAGYQEGGAAREKILKKIPLGRIGTPRDIAEAVLFLANASYITGQCIAVDGGRMAGSMAEY